MAPRRAGPPGSGPPASTHVEGSRGQMKVNEIHERLQAELGDAVGPLSEPKIAPFAVVRADRIVDAARFLKTTTGIELDHCNVISGVDWPKRNVIEGGYHLSSYRHPHGIVLKVEPDPPNPVRPPPPRPPPPPPPAPPPPPRRPPPLPRRPRPRRRTPMERLILRHAGKPEDTMLINFGPQHPSTHGVLNFLVETDGEVMKRAIPEIGYLHRAIEKIGEMVGYGQFMPYTDRIDYVAAMFANEGYALAVEKLLNVQAPPRAQWLRAVSGELCRIASHLVAVGAMASDIGASTPLVHALRERETLNDLIEMLCGARLTYNYHRIGGVAYDMPTGWSERVIRFLDHFDTMVQEFDRLISFNSIYVKRLANVAVIPREIAIDYGLVGPHLRGSGIDLYLL